MAISLVATLLALGVIQAVVAIPVPPNFARRLTCDSKFSELQGPGPFRVICPTRNTCLNQGPVYGCNKAYSEDSAICRAAIHRLGAETLGVGVVLTIDSLGERTNFRGKERNQVISTPYKETKPAYRFFLMKATCESQLMDMMPGNNGMIMFTCPKNANGNKCKNGGTVWGCPKAYTDDSSLCRSAIQAFGMDALAVGKVFTVERLGIRSKFNDFKNNGIKSKSWSTEWRAYRFLNHPTRSNVPQADCTTTLRKTFKGENGRIRFTCPTGNTCLNGGTVYGSPMAYTDDSALCRSAIHMFGVAEMTEGRIFTVQRQGIQSNFKSIDQNGVASKRYNTPYMAYTFLDRRPMRPFRTVDCDATVKTTFAGMTGTVRFTCPFGNECLSGGKVWGSPERYTTDSRLCRSAIHMYGSALDDPKILTIEILGTFSDYIALNQNGVSSLVYTSSHKAYKFVSMEEFVIGTLAL